MRIRRNSNLLIEPPSVATGDIAFNLLVFFLVCASSNPTTGRRQEMPASQKTENAQQTENLRVELVGTKIKLNDKEVENSEFVSGLTDELEKRKTREDKIVIVKSSKDVPYHRWVYVTQQIEQAGGTITIEIEEVQEQEAPAPGS
jgi:biopolymer transport protein ExbD